MIYKTSSKNEKQIRLIQMLFLHADYLGTCPSCGSMDIGIIKLYTGEDPLRAAMREYKRHGWRIKFLSPTEYDHSGLNPNRFCNACGREWLDQTSPQRIYFTDFIEKEAYLQNRNLGIDQVYERKQKENKEERKKRFFR